MLYLNHLTVGGTNQRGGMVAIAEAIAGRSVLASTKAFPTTDLVSMATRVCIRSPR